MTEKWHELIDRVVRAAAARTTLSRISAKVIFCARRTDRVRISPRRCGLRGLSSD
jgi:hypothetical protein